MLNLIYHNNMKKIVYAFILTSMLLISCEKENVTPYGPGVYAKEGFNKTGVDFDTYALFSISNTKYVLLKKGISVDQCIDKISSSEYNAYSLYWFNDNIDNCGFTETNYQNRGSGFLPGAIKSTQGGRVYK